MDASEESFYLNQLFDDGTGTGGGFGDGVTTAVGDSGADAHLHARPRHVPSSGKKSSPEKAVLDRPSKKQLKKAKGGKKYRGPMWEKRDLHLSLLMESGADDPEV
ncbi:unnamed protein product [Urochloa humidicola]